MKNTAVSEFSVHRMAVCKETSNVVVKFEGGTVVFYPFSSSSSNSASSGAVMKNNSNNTTGNNYQQHFDPVRLDMDSCLETALRDCLSIRQKHLTDPLQCKRKILGESSNKLFSCEAIAVDHEVVVGVFSPADRNRPFCSFIIVWDVNHNNNMSSSSSEKETSKSSSIRRAQAPIGNDVKTVLHLVIKNNDNGSSNIRSATSATENSTTLESKKTSSSSS